MTEADALEAERLWAERHVRQTAVESLSAFGLTANDLDQEKARARTSDRSAYQAIMHRVAATSDSLHHRQMAYSALALLAERDGKPSLEFRRGASTCELLRMERGFDAGFIVGVRVSTPRPWKPASEMERMREQGASIDEIAKSLGYSRITVERNLETRGADARVGPQCDVHAGRVFSLEQALASDALPCGERCICNWSPVLLSDYSVPKARR